MRSSVQHALPARPRMSRQCMFCSRDLVEKLIFRPGCPEPVPYGTYRTTEALGRAVAARQLGFCSQPCLESLEALSTEH
jgi:hypothetical protein